MLQNLHIKNYALIENLAFSPSPSFNIITGETGAGKSIMLGAIGLLLGNRADTKILYDPSLKCVIEGTFDVSGYFIEQLFEDEELDYSSTCVVRREISPSGKSRAFVNDTPVNLEALRRVTNQLMDVHSQHDSVLLGSNEYQLQIVDTYAQNDGLLREYAVDYQVYRTHKTALDKLKTEASAMRKEFDYNNFLYRELSKAQLQVGEQEQLEDELNVLENAEEIREKLQLAFDYLDNPEQSVVSLLKGAVSTLSAICKLSGQYTGLQERAQSTLIELRDLADEISTGQDAVETDETRAETVRERLNTFYQLFKKHSVSTVDGLLTIQAELQQKVSKVENMDEEMAAAEQAATEARTKMMHIAEVLSEIRCAALPGIESEVRGLLHELGMPNSSLRIASETGKPLATGIDTVTFMFSANKGIKPQQLKNVASGGEFSRLMLAIKYILASKRSLPTIIFDEIDTGVSGEIAIRMGNMMKDMAHNHQIIAITHLPQIAAQGTRHYFVYKDHSADRTVSRIRQLSFDERVAEIAQMIGGKSPSANTIKNAREILKQGKMVVAK